MAQWGPGDYDEFVRRPHIWVNAEYGKILRRLRSSLPEASLKVLFYEDLHADQRGTLIGIEDFLGIPHFDYPQAQLDRRFTESVQHQMPDFFPELVMPDVERICAEVEAEGYAIPTAWSLRSTVSA